MANRHLSRSIVLQSLFELDFTGAHGDIRDFIDRTEKEFGPGQGDTPFMHMLAAGVLEHKKDLDMIIEKAAPDWPLNKIAPVDLTILRMGLFELLFEDRGEVPAKVAINEAIELAKEFGGESSGRFVNGVLGAVYKEIGEPGKDETSKKKKIKDIPYDKMPIERLAGAVVYAQENDDVYLALVHDVFGHWTLSKGGIEPEEDIKEGLIREIKDEIGVEIAVEDELGANEYIASHPEKGKVRKQVTYFLGRAPFQDLKLSDSGGLDDARWFKLKDIVNLNIYDDILPIITKSINLLLSKTSS